MMHIWAQTMVEYGVISTVAAKVSGFADAVEASVRDDTGVWMMAAGGLVFALWIFRKR